MGRSWLGMNEGRGSTEENLEGESKHHKGWKARENPSAQDSGGCFPLREAHNHKDNSDGKSLGPFDAPYASNARTVVAACASSKAPDGRNEKRVILRCMYTNQKTKKRKTWSDGAVKCCPTSQRVSLYRWSEALGVTHKLLGDMYLTVPQYEAFVKQDEPELEMEVYIVSLDGVTQPGGDPPNIGAATSTHAAGSAGGPPAGITAAGYSSGGGAGGGAGRKRKLFKVFRPPARRAPVPAPPLPEEVAWGLPPPGGMGRLRNGGERNDGGHWPASGGVGGGGGGRESSCPRASYTGFGHVESLSDDDEESGEGGGDYERGRRRPRGMGAGSAGLAAVGGNAGWGIVAGVDHSSGASYDGDSGRESSVLPRAWPLGALTQHEERMQQTPPAAAAATNPNDWMRGQEDRRHLEVRGGGESSGPSRWSRSFSQPDERLQLSRAAAATAAATAAEAAAEDFAGQLDSSSYGAPAHDDDRDDPSPDLQSLLRSGGGPRLHIPASRGGARGTGEAGSHDGRYRSGSPQQHDGAGPVAWAGGGGAEEGPPVFDATSEYGGGVRSPEFSRGSADSSESAGGGGGGGARMRSTQDILSLFGGFEQKYGGAQSPREPGWPRTIGSPLKQLIDAPAGPEATRGTLLPIGGGGSSRAAMRRTQKDARAAAGGAAVTARVAAHAEIAREVCAASATDAVGDIVASPQAGWTCGVCGVRGGPSSKSCRVCGAERQVRLPSGGNGDFQGDDGLRGRGGVDFDRGTGWQERGRKGAAGNQAAAADGLGDGEGGPSVGGVEVAPHERHGGAELGKRGSTSPRPISHMSGAAAAEGPGSSSAGGAARASSEHWMVAGVRMQMDVGSSPDSDDA